MRHPPLTTLRRSRAVLPWLALAGCASMIHMPTLPPVPSDIVGHRVSRDAAMADVDFLLTTYDHVHPNLYVHVPRDSVAAMRNAVVRALPDSVTRGELWVALAPIVAGFGDGHTNLQAPTNEAVNAAVRGDLVLPLVFAMDEVGRLIVARSETPDSVVTPGAVVLSVNGHPADSLLGAFSAQMSGERLAYRHLQVAAGFSGLLWLNGIRGPYVVRVRATDGVVREERITTRPRVPIRLRPAAPPRPPGTGFAYQRQADHVGYMDFYSMGGDLGQFRSELTRVFAQIAADSVRTLVIDLRRNGGGDSRMGDALIEHFSDRPYRQDSRKDWRMSDEYRAYIKSMLPGAMRWMPVEYLSGDGRRMFRGPAGGVVTFATDVHTPERAEPFFSGPVCFLIGPGTFSSAVDLASAVKDFHLATLIGEESGGIPNTFGEAYFFELPNTRMIASVSSAFFVRPSGDSTDFRGVVPDIEVRRTAADVVAQTDPVMERARRCPERPRG
jgi:hypothetical protein